MLNKLTYHDRWQCTQIYLQRACDEAGGAWRDSRNGIYISTLKWFLSRINMNINKSHERYFVSCSVLFWYVCVYQKSATLTGNCNLRRALFYFWCNTNYSVTMHEMRRPLKNGGCHFADIFTYWSRLLNFVHTTGSQSKKSVKVFSFQL